MSKDTRSGVSAALAPATPTSSPARQSTRGVGGRNPDERDAGGYAWMQLKGAAGAQARFRRRDELEEHEANGTLTRAGRDELAAIRRVEDGEEGSDVQSAIAMSRAR